MKKYRHSLYFIKFALDVFLLAISFFLASFIARKRIYPKEQFFNFDKRELALLFVLLAVWYFSTKASGLYDEFRSRTLSFELLSVLKNCLLQFIVSILFLFTIKTMILSRYFIFVFFMIQLTLLSVAKFSTRTSLQWLRAKGRYVSSMLILGAGKVGRDFFQALKSCPHLGYKVEGFLDDKPQPDLGFLYLGSIEDLNEILGEHSVDEVIIALPNSAGEKIKAAISICENNTISARIIPDYFQFLSHNFDISIFGYFPIISLKNPLEELHWRIFKRIFDTAFTIVLFLFAFVWLWPIIVIAIKIDSSGPVFFKQERWGRKNRKITILKFRSMVKDSKDVDENGNYQQASRYDPRITKIGRFLRKTSMDELPQFMNVLKGEMSIVGPRPHPTPLNLESKDRIPHYMLRHLVKPGITGWAQINGYRGETRDPIYMEKRIAHDLWYIENWSFWLDLQIILLTIKQIFKGNINAY